MGEFNVNKTTGGLDPTAGMPSEYPATHVMMSDGTTSVEDAMLKAVEIPFSNFSWIAVNNRYEIANYAPTVNHLLGYLVTWENGSVASIIYHNTSTSTLVIGGLLAGGAAITSNYQFKCFEIGF